METQNTTIVSMVAREKIINAAERIFLQQGFHKVSMDELAAELGMSKKTLYRHFSSKEELLVAVLRHRTAHVGEKVQELLDSRIPYPEKFRDLLILMQQRMSEINPIFLSDLQKYAPQCFAIVEEFRGRKLPDFFGQLLDEGITAGVLRADMNRALFIPVLVNSIQTLVRPGVLAELKMHPWNAIDGILQIFFEGILTPQGRRTCGKHFKHS